MLDISFDMTEEERDEDYMNLMVERKALLDEYEALRSKLRRLLGMDDAADSAGATVRKMSINSKRACNMAVKRMKRIQYRLGETMIDENDMCDIYISV